MEDREPGDGTNVGRFNLSLHGTRDAAMNWQDEFIEIFVKNEFQRGNAFLCNLHHQQRKLRVTVHGGDFTSTGTKRQFKWFNDLLDSIYECKHQWFGFDNEEEKFVRTLNGVICWNHVCIICEADSRHVDVVLTQLQLGGASLSQALEFAKNNLKAMPPHQRP